MIRSLVIALLLFATTANAEVPFSVDERSWIHFGASMAIGATADTALILGDAGKTGRILFSAIGCMSIGVAKELRDQYVDYGDLTFDAIGCLAGIGLAEGVRLVVKRNGLNFSVEF